MERSYPSAGYDREDLIVISISGRNKEPPQLVSIAAWRTMVFYKVVTNLGKIPASC